MGRKSGSAEAVLVRHVAVHGRDVGKWFELQIDGQPELAELLELDYPNMTRRIKQSDLLELRGNVLRLKKVGRIEKV